MCSFKRDQTNVLKIQAVCSLFRTCVVEQMGTCHWGAFQTIWFFQLKFHEHFADVFWVLQCNCFVKAVGTTHWRLSALFIHTWLKHTNKSLGPNITYDFCMDTDWRLNLRKCRSRFLSQILIFIVFCVFFFFLLAPLTGFQTFCHFTVWTWCTLSSMCVKDAACQNSTSNKIRSGWMVVPSSAGWPPKTPPEHSSPILAELR